jgi:uncharacterized protein YbjT (DUF2867 family)
MMILVTGAQGNIGREVRRLLVATGVPVRFVTRNPTDMGDGQVLFDFERPENLRAGTCRREAAVPDAATGHLGRAALCILW